MSGRRHERPLLLAYRPLGLGDLLTAVPALRALARAMPDHRLVLCAPAALEPLVALTGVVDEVSVTPELGVPAEPWHHADLAVNLHGRGPQSHRALAAASPRTVIAFGCEAAGHAGPAWRPGEHEVHRWCRLLAESGIPADPSDLALEPPPGVATEPEEPVTVIHPGAASPARRWPAGRWAQVARAESQRGRTVLVTGSRAETALAEEVAAAAGLPAGAVRAGRTNLAELARLVASAGRVLCADTGVAHLATALGTPSVVLFGPTPPGEWGPPRGRVRHVALWKGRRGDPHADRTDPGLLAISTDEVLAAIDRLPGVAAGSAA